jgi:[ribosomal protein S18]-alanine N-acetyltransferase
MTRDPRGVTHHLRRFEPRDAQASRAIGQQSPEAAQWSDNAWRQLDSGGQSAWVAESPEGEVVGFLVVRAVGPDQGEILNLAVAPAKRRSGYATALLRACMHELGGRKIREVFLEVRESNTAAMAFYTQQGFVRTGYRPGYYQHPTEAAVLLVRILTV